MVEYIDRHSLKNDGHLCYHDDKGNVFYEVDHAPIIDAVEVVRCNDCQYWQDKNSAGTQGICLCGEKDMNYGGEFYPLANDYCSYGERRNT